jgi:RND superfamily putative drug exporter
MYKSLGRFAASHPWQICAAWVSVAILLALVAPKWDNHAQDDDIRFLPARCDSVRGYHLLEKAFPQDVFASRLIFAVVRPDAPLGAEDLALVDGMVEDLNQLRQTEPGLGINRIVSHQEPILGKRLVSADSHCTLIQVALNSPYLALQTRATVDRADQVVRARLASVSNPPEIYTTGAAGIGRDLVSASGDSLESTTLATIILVVVILLLVHRAPLLALVPLLTIACSVCVALKVLALCTLIPGFYLINISQVFAVVMLYGAGTDYCLFLISRYREELAQGHNRDIALERSVGGVGSALAASAGTVICGLGLMGLAEFAKVRCGGPAIAISLAVALLASLTLAPALLKLMGRIVFWPGRQPRREEVVRHSDLWTRLSKQVLARPMAIWVTALLVLLPLALVGCRVKSNYKATSELSPRASSVQGLEAIERHFSAGEVGPITVLLESKLNWDSEEGRRIVNHLSQGFGFLDNIAEVRSLTQPLGERLPESSGHDLLPRPAGGLAGLKALVGTVVQDVQAQVKQAAREFYLARVPGADGTDRYVTRIDVVMRSDPFEPRSAVTLDLIQTWLREYLPEQMRELGTPNSQADLADLRAECFGVTVNSRDLAEVTEHDRLRINTMVLAAIFLILLALVRKPWLAGYLLVTVLFSYLVTLGATTLVAHWWSGRPLGEVDWRVPFFLFTILVAVGEDYNILLVSRALQEKKRHGHREGMRRALACTGGTITSCGLIMAGTFATLMLAGLNTLVQIGFALAFGVLLDTFVVRPFLVPALTMWMWKGEPAPVKAQTKPAKLELITTLRRAA